METSISTLRSVEVLPVLGGRRRWPDELKARIVAETLEAGATVRGLARRYGVHETQLSRRPRNGSLFDGSTREFSRNYDCLATGPAPRRRRLCCGVFSCTN